jgi:hypothetical protein
MKASENKKPVFEEAWKNAFEGVEKSPPPGVWDKVEVALSEKENGKLKKRLFLFKLLVAASIAFAAILVGYQYWLTETSADGQKLLSKYQQEILSGHSDTGKMESADKELKNSSATLNEKPDSPSDATKSLTQTPSENNLIADETENGRLNNIDQAAGRISVAYPSDAVSKGPEVPANTPGSVNNRIIPIPYLTSYEPQFVNLKEPDMAFDHVYSMPIVPPGYGKKLRYADYESTLWAGLDMGAGQFNPNSASAGSIAPSNNFSADLESGYDLATLSNARKTSLGLNEEKIEPAQSFAFGISSGYQFARRWMVIGGIQYRKSVASVESLLLYAKNSGGQYPLTSWNERDAESASAVLSDAGISLRNNFEFLALPVGIGYLIKDGKFSILLKGALANEWLISAELEDESGQLNTLDLTGENSPYNTYMLSGRIGTAFGYHFIDNYLITLEPAYQHALTPLTNDRYSGEESRPANLMISFGITYIFNR